MNIGFDAKRAFHNDTGLGHYSRTLIKSLATYFPYHRYFLFNPTSSTAYQLRASNIMEVRPKGFTNNAFSSLWRMKGITKDLGVHAIDIYHGLSHEIPIGIHKKGIKSVVTIHDLIHERYPKQYSKIDVKIYRKKFVYACTHADKIIAISEQTKADIIDFYKISPEKITVCYQSCDPIFSKHIDAAEKELVKATYKLPEKYFLYVGSIIERKNLLSICKALTILQQDRIHIPLVVIGKGGKYKDEVKAFIALGNLEKSVIFLSDTNSSYSKVDYNHFPAIYNGAIAMIYPSFFEGFGIPVLEALCSGTPVITSNTSCLPEAGGDAAYYINPSNPREIATAMKAIYENAELANQMINKGLEHAKRFTQEACACAVMDVYNSLFIKK